MEYCAHCGAETTAASDRCERCGVRKQAARPSFRRNWMWIYVGATSVVLAAVTFAPLLDQLFMPLEVVPGGQIQLIVHGSLLKLVALLAIFGVSGALLSGLARRSIRIELALGGVVLTAVQWGLWIARTRDVGALLTSPIAFVNDNGGMILPPFIGLLLVNGLSLCTALVFGAAARLGIERASGEAACEACGHLYKIVPKRPDACPECGQPTSESKPTTRWSRVGVTVLATAAAFVLAVRLGGPPLAFYWSCDFAHPSATCQAGIDAFNRSKPGDLYFWRDQRGESVPGVILDSWDYVLFTSPLFALGPMLVAIASRRGRGSTARMSALLAWPAATLGAMVFLGFAEFESILVLSLRLHLLAGIPWCAAGFFGAWLGQKLGPQVDLAEELGIELPPPAASSSG